MKMLRVVSSAVLLVCSLVIVQNSSAISAGDLKNIKVIGHHSTTRIASGNKTASITNPSSARYLVLDVSAEVPSDGSILFGPDFLLQYFHQGGKKEDRAKCEAICWSTGGTFDDRDCSIGEYSALRLDEGIRYLSLVFFMENDVHSVSLGRIGAGPITYQIGLDRPFSVHVATNRGPDALAKAEKIIRAGGYQVTSTSTKLPEEKKGITIHFADGAEVQAREISQRVMTEMRVVPEVKKMKLIAASDIVIWIGK